MSSAASRRVAEAWMVWRASVMICDTAMSSTSPALPAVVSARTMSRSLTMPTMCRMSASNRGAASSSTSTAPILCRASTATTVATVLPGDTR